MLVIVLIISIRQIIEWKVGAVGSLACGNREKGAGHDCGAGSSAFLESRARLNNRY